MNFRLSHGDAGDGQRLATEAGEPRPGGDATVDTPLAWQGLQACLPPGTFWHWRSLSRGVSRGVDEVPALAPEEAAAVARAVASRQREFAVGRWCARRALSAMGVPPAAIPVGPHRAPVWPDGVTGSISHDEHWCIAGVARQDRWSGLGVDTELVDRVRLDMAPQLCTPGERARWFDDVPCADPVERLARVFSIKEAAFKVLFPIFAQWIDFHHAEVVQLPEGAAGSFRVRLLVQMGSCPDMVLSGVQGLAEGRVVSVLAWSRPG
jgi:4'-phosphopantetheinyl transferase EntD